MWYHFSQQSLLVVLVNVVCRDFLAASWNRRCSSCTFLASLLLCTLGRRNDCTRSLMRVSLLLNRRSKLSKCWFISCLRRFAMMLACRSDALSTVSLRIQFKQVSTVPWFILTISSYRHCSLALIISSAFLRPASSISRFLLSSSAASTIFLIFFSSVTLRSFLDRSSRVSAMISPWSPSYMAFLKFSSCSCNKISSASFSGSEGILATISNSSIRANRFSLPSYMMFCWARPLKIRCRNRIATSFFMKFFCFTDSSFNSCFEAPTFHSLSLKFSSFFMLGVCGRATTFLRAWMPSLTTSSSAFSGLSFLSIPFWATSKAFLCVIQSLGSFPSA